MNEPFEPAPIIERTPGYQALRRSAKRRALPGTRPLKEPTGPCHCCDLPATRCKGHTPLCDRHYAAVNELLNHGETAAVAAVVKLAKAERGERGSLRDRLKARHAASWPDRPITQFIPMAGD